MIELLKRTRCCGKRAVKQGDKWFCPWCQNQVPAPEPTEIVIWVASEDPDGGCAEELGVRENEMPFASEHLAREYCELSWRRKAQAFADEYRGGRWERSGVPEMFREPEREVRVPVYEPGHRVEWRPVRDANRSQQLWAFNSQARIMLGTPYQVAPMSVATAIPAWVREPVSTIGPDLLEHGPDCAGCRDGH